MRAADDIFCCFYETVQVWPPPKVTHTHTQTHWTHTMSAWFWVNVCVMVDFDKTPVVSRNSLVWLLTRFLVDPWSCHSSSLLSFCCQIISFQTFSLQRCRKSCILIGSSQTEVEIKKYDFIVYIFNPFTKPLAISKSSQHEQTVTPSLLQNSF